ncbi:hypothetical protein CDD83_8874 [Cordyceps sp. RAO-2017]|nr:hypothetical protein CDD83_8874 [Cordyceps sp. RAO-2017]
MAPPKRNEFLDGSDSEDNPFDGLDSDDEITKGRRRAPKRRKADTLQDDDPASHSDSDASVADEAVKEPRTEKSTRGKEPGQGREAEGAEEREEGAARDGSAAKTKRSEPKLETELPDVTRPLAKKNLVASEKAIKRSGVVFLSRIPPFMKPAKLRSLLEPNGTINRIFLAPEDPTAHARRVRAGGNKKRMFTEGWVEFVRKRDAKAACELLNARIIGGKKGGYYHDDIWNLLYLKGFKWHHLTEQIATENAERTSRMRAEISKATRENKEFVRNVERAKMLDGMQAKARKRKARDGDGDDPDGDAQGDASEQRVRAFRQVPQIRKTGDSEERPEHVARVLSKIF